MKPMTAGLFCLCLASGLTAGCATPRKPKEAAPPPAYMTAAVLKSFADIFDGSWGGVTVYIEQNAWIPADLRKVGHNRAEVTLREALLKRLEGTEVAPAMAVVNAWEEPGGVVRVRINYDPLRMKGAQPQTRGGNFEYAYRLVEGQLVMISRLKSLN